MMTEDLEALMDRLVAEYSDRLQAGADAPRHDLLQQVPPERRGELERCLRMIELGLAGAPSAQRPLTPGLVLERYRLERELGRGGMALVWLARDLDLERPVALKILRPGLALEQRHVDRFRREGLAVARLDHPHVVGIHGVGQAHGYHWLAMEYVDGPTLADLLHQLPRDREPTVAEAAERAGIPALARMGNSFEELLGALFAPLAEGLAVAHELGIVHRDIKPYNILLHRDGRAVLADFGLAKEDGNPALSLTGDAIGTPSYMSPEQAGAVKDRIDHRTDLYSLGVAMYEALTGRRPFDGESVLAVIDAIRNGLPAPVRSLARWCSKDAAAIVSRAMQREPEDRYPSAAELARDLRALAEGRPPAAATLRFRGLRGIWPHAALAMSGQGYVYRSERTFLGWPLVHVNLGQRGYARRPRVARGWLAISDVAIGGIAFGNIAGLGGIAVGGAAGLGVFGLGGALSVGLLIAVAGAASFGTVAIAGAFAAGLIAVAGGAAMGWMAVGGTARGVWVLAGHGTGEHVLSGERRDPEAIDFFQTWMPWMMDRFE